MHDNEKKYQDEAINNSLKASVRDLVPPSGENANSGSLSASRPIVDFKQSVAIKSFDICIYAASAFGLCMAVKIIYGALLGLAD